MIELSFPTDLYPESAVDDAVRAYHEVAECQVETRADHRLVRVIAKSDVDEQLLADELGNYALGLAVERRGG